MGLRGLNQGVENTSRDFSQMSKDQAEVLHLLTKEFLTPKQISKRRKTSITAVYKIINKLAKKGFISHIKKQGFKISTPLFNPPLISDGSKKAIRLHAEEYHICIITKSDKYQGLIGKTIFRDGNTIHCHRDVLEVYSGHSFIGQDASAASAQSVAYWGRFFHTLESELSLCIIKDRAQNIKRVAQHFSEVDNELAVDADHKGQKVNIKAPEDSKTWFTIDNSFNLHEAEFKHPSTAKHDCDKIVPFFNDLRASEPVKVSEIMVLLKEIVILQKENTAGMACLVELSKARNSPPSESPSKHIGRPDYIF